MRALCLSRKCRVVVVSTRDRQENMVDSRLKGEVVLNIFREMTIHLSVDLAIYYLSRHQQKSA